MPGSYTNMGTIGYMPMPISFRYKTLFLMGRPRHEKYDDFWRKHPPMDHVHRAKIFAPFDALAGFDDIIEVSLLAIMKGMFIVISRYVFQDGINNKKRQKPVRYVLIFLHPVLVKYVRQKGEINQQFALLLKQKT